jgi:hypothetical protein
LESCEIEYDDRTFLKDKEMNLPRILLIAILLLSSSYLTGQSTDDENNWYKETNRGDNWYTKFDFHRYTKDDIQTAKTKYLQIVARQDLDEWEGTYYQHVMLGHTELTWSRDDGFVEARTYHTLAGLNYGRTTNNFESVRFYSEKPTKPSTKTQHEEFIKVKFGNAHFLIPQQYLRNFAERAAGLTSVSEENEYYWIKSSDENKKIFVLPKYPKRFHHLIRKPIRTRLVSIGKPILRRDKFVTGEVYAKYHDRLIAFDAGSTRGVRINMVFFSDDLDERIQIVRVSKTRSFGILSRSLSMSNKEICWVDDSLREKERPCVPLISGVVARTLSQEFSFK